MIVAPTNDEACLGQLTQIARELAQTTLIRTVAERLGSPSAVQMWLQSLPQTDDDGSEAVRSITCDVPQRVRLLPDDPNCFERSLAALALLEVVEPRTMRMLVTAEKPARHTGIVEWRRGAWVALDLFPRRNINWRRLGGNVLEGIREVHHYVGKPVMTFYGLGGVADLLDQKGAQLAGAKVEKKQTPPTGAAVAAAVGALAGVGGKPQPERKGGADEPKKEPAQRGPAAAPALPGSAAGRNRDPFEEEEPELGDWWGVE